ncbi:tetraacyldisaccharide 4'-kinase [Cellvibrio japonicus Ueda107]|uniref:Tetraacyldisaccharide 4'-kinase n=1 Tax=Cellvibrio japonicus (strain Ueda107) TaxID=498211 RepID=B3PFR8_CELJU|nr:tetraacyldisaccharide 4'-kinase [Cellvibrio japonicus Ueda107]
MVGFNLAMCIGRMRLFGFRGNLSLRPSSTSSSTSSRQQAWLDAWYGQRRWTLWLLPLMWIFVALSRFRRWWILRYQQVNLPTPLIVVGNISVGGTGKTPLLIALVKHFQAQGYNPGVISRGYGGRAPNYPYLVESSSTPAEAGDEPISIYRQTGCAICVGPDRVAAARYLEDLGCDLLLSDDGLQHYRLGRDIEIALVDGLRGVGNGHCLPVGPLRESAERLKSVDWVVANSPSDSFSLPVDEPVFTIPMAIAPLCFQSLLSTESLAIDAFTGKSVHAVAGIGNPRRFYQSLQLLGVEPVEHSYPDHHSYAPADLAFDENLPVVMTEKDAVKCRAFAQENWYYLVIEARLPDLFWSALDNKVGRVKEQKKAAFE